MDIYVLAVAIVLAPVVGWVTRPRWTFRWAVYVAAPLLTAAALLVAFGGLNPIGPPTLVDVLLIAFVAVLFGNLVRQLPEVQGWLTRRGGTR